MEEISALTKLWQDRRRPSAEVKKIAEAHLAELERKIQELESMKEALRHLVDGCRGDERPDCPILGSLGDN